VALWECAEVNGMDFQNTSGLVAGDAAGLEKFSPSSQAALGSGLTPLPEAGRAGKKKNHTRASTL